MMKRICLRNFREGNFSGYGRKWKVNPQHNITHTNTFYRTRWNLRQRKQRALGTSMQQAGSTISNEEVAFKIEPNSHEIKEMGEDYCFDTIDSALEAVARGEFIVVLDDNDRENEGDLIAAAELVTAEKIAFMIEHTSGVLCIGMEGADLDRLKLPLMVPPSENTDAKCTSFTITTDLKQGTTTGISASDRAKTFNALANKNTQASDLRRPGHVFPLRYSEGGVLIRRGHTEASVDLARLAGCYPAGVLSEIVNRFDGSMARLPQCFEFAKLHGLKIITIESLVQYRRRTEHGQHSLDR